MSPFKECKKCIYRPCGKAPNEDAGRFCFIRLLIWEADEAAGLHKKKTRNGKKGAEKRG